MYLKTLTSNTSFPFKRAAVSGVLISLTWLLTLLDIAFSPGLAAPATLLAWSYVALELKHLKAKQRKQILALLFAGLAAAVLAWANGYTVGAQALFGEHLKLAMLLAAVSFISLAANLSCAPGRTGAPSFITTLTGMHLFSSVANFSSVIMVGDQVKRNGHVDQLSQFILCRGFGLAVLWSPFLSIIALVLGQVSGTDLSTIYPFSITLAVFGLAATLIEARLRSPDQLAHYAGYPLKRSTLMLPGILIVLIILLSQLLPSLPTVFLVSLLAVIVPVALNLWRHGAGSTGRTVATHVSEKLAESRSEISLFLSAGVLAAGVKACIAAGLVSLPFTETNATIASLVLVLIVLLSYLGIHQLALVAIFAGLLADITTTPNQMAIAYILGTGLAMSGSTFSGLNFIMKARFNCEDREILRNQLPFNLLMIMAGSGAIYTMEHLGIR